MILNAKVKELEVKKKEAGVKVVYRIRIGIDTLFAWFN